jgi:hypothetical protein
MTLPASGTSNQWGYFYSSNVPVNDPSNPPEPAPAVNVAQSTPSPATWNANAGETSTENYVSAMVAASQDGVPFDFQSNVTVTEDLAGKFDVETIPTAPSGSFAQEGVAAISNVAQITASFAGTPASQIAVNNWTA